MPSDDAHHRRLAVYGTLAPGGRNHHVVEPLRGTWEVASLSGHLEWLTAEVPRLRWDEDGPVVPAWLLTASALPSAWPRLDVFEGPAYERRIVPVQLAHLVVPAWCYVRPG